MKSPSSIAWRARALLRREGSIAVLIAVLLVAVLGFVSLGTEIGVLLFTSRKMQSVTDSAAYGAAFAQARGYPANYAAEATAIAGAAGFVQGQGGTTIVVNDPPASGRYRGNSKAVEVIITQPQTLALASLLGVGQFTLTARAVALTLPSVACIVALDPTAPSAVSLTNNAAVPNTLCGVVANSNSPTALFLNNNASIDGPVNVVGGWSLANGAALTGTPKLENSMPITNPYANLALPSPLPACTSQTASAKESATLSLLPGYFCQGWSLGNSGTINLAAGTYYVKGGISLGNDDTVNGSAGVSIVITDNAVIGFGNNDTFNITAPNPSSGQPFPGMAVMGLSNSPNVTQTFPYNAIINIKGAIYFPNEIIEFDNNTETSAGGCTQIIGRIVKLQNNVTIEDNCTGVGTKTLTFWSVKLVE